MKILDKNLKIKSNYIENILVKNLKAISKEDYKMAFTGDEKVIKAIKKKIMNSDFLLKEEITAIHRYVYALEIVVRYQLDSGEDNKSVEIYTDLLLNNSLDSYIKKLFPLRKLVINLISANINMHKQITAKLIYQKYIHILTEVNKSEIFKMIISKTNGKLHIEEDIYPLLDNFENEIEAMNEAINKTEEKNSKIRKKRNYLLNMYHIANSINEKTDKYANEIKKEIMSTFGKVSAKIFKIISLAATDENLIDIAWDWISSINYHTLEIANKKKYTDVKYIIERNKGKYGNNIEARGHSIFKAEYLNQHQLLNTLLIDKKSSRHSVALFAEGVEQMIIDIANNDSIELKQIANLIRRLYLVKGVRRSQGFWENYELALSKIESVKKSDTAFFFINDYSLVNGAFSLPIMLEGKKRGYYCVPTSPRTFKFDESDDLWLNDLAGTMNSDIDTRYSKQTKSVYDWKIDIANKRIEANGFNIYQPIFEFVSRYQFTYLFHYETDAWAKNKVHQLILTFDRLFQYCEEIYEWAKQENVKVRFISNAPHLHNAAAYRIFCEVKGHEIDMNYVCVVAGYDNYFKNVGDAQSDTLTALNLTKNPNSRSSFLGTEKDFQKYYNENLYRINEIREKVEKLLNYQRSHLSHEADVQKKNAILELIKKYKTEKKKIYLLNGKVIFDLGVNYTKGCGHSDMADWITNTVEIIKNNPDILLLIKPHPHEQRKDLTMTSDTVDCLRDIITTELFDNTIYLDNNMFKIGELINYVDLGLIWNGTSSLEFAAYGIKTIIADEWGHKDYPIGFINFNSKEEYEEILLDPDKFPQEKDLQEKAMVFLEYMGSDAVAIPNPYTKTTTLNYNQFDNSKIFLDKVDNYIEKGDSNLSRLVDTLL